MNIRRWIIAARPKTLPIAVAPLAVGWSNTNWEHPALWAIACITALQLQVLSNFSNDLFDYIRGADNKERTGPLRAVQSGLITPREMLNSIYLLIWGLCFSGLLLYAYCGWPILILGLLSIGAALLYTSTQFALAYNGLGEVGVFIFFGLVNVVGAEYVVSGNVSNASIVMGIACGLLAATVILFNNIRDLRTDQMVGKKTLAVIVGRPWAELILYGLLFFPYILVTCYWHDLLPFHPIYLIVSLPLAIIVACGIANGRTDLYNKLLAFAVLHLILFSGSYVFLKAYKSYEVWRYGYIMRGQLEEHHKA
jgi:1,4-dihydroxy-2-naphthoate octaprenyltransferase